MIHPQQWKQFPQIRWLKLYGSRALGRQRPGSDIDLAFSSPEDCSAALAAAFDELPTPYRVDVTHWESLRHEGLRQHIARCPLWGVAAAGLRASASGIRSSPLGHSRCCSRPLP